MCIYDTLQDSITVQCTLLDNIPVFFMKCLDNWGHGCSLNTQLHPLVNGCHFKDMIEQMVHNCGLYLICRPIS